MPAHDSIDDFLSTLKSVDCKGGSLACHKSQHFYTTEVLFRQTGNTTNKTQPNDFNSPSFQSYLASMQNIKSQDLDSQTRNTTNKTQQNDINRLPHIWPYMACLNIQDFDSTGIRSSRNHSLSLDYPTMQFFPAADGPTVSNPCLLDDKLVGKIPLDGSDVQDQLITRNPASKNLQLPKLQQALPVECNPSCSKAALQKVAEPSTTTLNKRRRDYKPRRVVPETKDYVKACKDKDVISGKGTGFYNHPGNRFCNDLVKTRLFDYLQASDTGKSDIVNEIIKTIQERDGQFLEKELETGSLYVSPKENAKTKVSQAFRDQAAKRAKYA
jgi:hypothetical protein